MRIGVVLRRWIEILAALYLAWCESRREFRSLVVTRENGHIVVRRAEPARDAMLRDAQAGNVVAILPPGAGVSADVSRAAHNSFVVLEFPADKVVMRRITVPAQARKFLSGVIRNQIERLSPWPANGVVYGFATEAGAGDAAVVEVRILMAARTDVDAAQQDLAALGLPVDRIVARGSDSEAVDATHGSVTLWSRLADSSPERPPAERAWLLKETSISSVILIEALSRSLPESAYVNEIRLEKESLRITGLADDAPALLAPLERSEHLTDVHFFAPMARGPDGKLFRFSIEAHVEPRIKIGEH